MDFAPLSVQDLVRTVLPAILRCADGERAMACVREIVASDRWNSFERFQHTTATLLRHLRDGGAVTDVWSVQTGGPAGDGRWVIQEAADIESGTVDLVFPLTERVTDYRLDPWAVVQWSASGPRGGVSGDLVVIDSWEAVEKLAPRALTGKVVLTHLSPYHSGHRWAEKGALGVLCDTPVKGLPSATQWGKFGWGGVEVGRGTSRLMGFMLSSERGAWLRALVREHGRAVVKLDLSVRRYVGTHDVVSGRVLGGDDPQDEVWAVAHSMEPGAADNASGVAVCVEACRVLESLISSGELHRPKRSIRILAGYECYGFFDYLAHGRRLQAPLAGICVDCVGVRPELCSGSLQWHDTVPSSAGFVDELGFCLLESALALENPGYELRRRPFTSTEDTLLGDPRYGFPCPYLGHFPYRGYHSSADTPDILDSRGLAVCTTAVAAYLYYLADAATDHVRELASWYTGSLLASDSAPGGHAGRGALVRARSQAATGRLTRWLWGGDRVEALDHLASCGQRAEAGVASAMDDAPCAVGPVEGRLVPWRRVPLAPTYENVPADAREELQRSGVHKWALYWADGSRSLEQIRCLAGAESDEEYSLDQVATFFRVMETHGYVTLVAPESMTTVEELVGDLGALGVRAGMDLLVHSSLSSIGFVQGGADSVVDALLKAIGPRGTLFMPSFNHNAAEVFNPMVTPTTNGAIPDAMWRRPEAVRSIHPTHALAAIGPKAATWCAGHLEKGVWAEDSPIGRLVHNGGYILGLGVDHTASTAYHVAEISLGAGCLDQFGSSGRVVGPDGEVRTVRGLAWRGGACPVSPRKLCATLDERGLQRRGSVGCADSVLVKALELWRVRREHLRDACPACRIKPLRTDVEG